MTEWSEWLAILAMALIAGLWISRPFLRRGSVEPTESEMAVSIYRGQLDELDREVKRGLLAPEEQDQAQREIAGRTLRAARRIETAVKVPRRSPIAGLVLTFAVLGGTAGTYLVLGSPETPDQPLAKRRAEALEKRAAAGDAAARAELAADKVEATPESFQKYWTLAHARAKAGDHSAAAEAFRFAAEASDDSPPVLAAYAEALTLANGNRVPTAARIVLAQVLAKTPHDPRARYYSALAKAQSRDFEGALTDWYALYTQSAPDAPWNDRVRRDIVNMVRFTGKDLKSLLPDATEAELAAVAAGPPNAISADKRIDALRASLARDPKQYLRSIELADLLAAKGEEKAAIAALDDAATVYAAAPLVTKELKKARAKIAGPAGPTDKEVAAAAEMDEAERKEMVSNMVAGLAKRLATQPNDLDGWLMLIRSYAVMQKREDANKAIGAALAQFPAETKSGQAIVRLAAELGLDVTSGGKDG